MLSEILVQFGLGINRYIFAVINSCLVCKLFLPRINKELKAILVHFHFL